MFPPKFAMQEIKVGSGDIIGQQNLENFFTHVSTLYDLDDKPIVKLTYDYETAVAALVEMIEAKFVNLNHIIQQMFLKLDSMEEGEDKNFVLRTLLNEFRDVAREARNFFKRYGYLDICPSIAHTMKIVKANRLKYARETECEDVGDIPIPFKLLGIAEALNETFDWISPENLFDEASTPKGKKKVDPETYVTSIQCLYQKFASLNLNDNT